MKLNHIGRTLSFGALGALALSAFTAANAAGEKEAKSAATPISQVYSLDTCPVSGKPLAKEPITRTIDGREVRFCCEMCPTGFEADKAKYFAKIDTAIIAQQTAMYPLANCPVGGGALGSMGEPVNMVVGNSLVKLCCAGCESKVRADPAKYTAMIDAAIIEKQGKDYPLTNCPVGGGALGSMGDPVNLVVGGRLIKLCCAGCEAKVRAQPAKYIAEIDAARAKATKGQ